MNAVLKIAVTMLVLLALIQAAFAAPAGDWLINSLLVVIFAAAFAAVSQLPKAWQIIGVLLLSLLFFGFAFLVMFELVLVDFSGRGFTDEVFFHFEAESVRIAFEEYPVSLFGFFAFLALVLVLFQRWAAQIRISKWWWFAIVAVAGFVVLHSHSVVARFVQAWVQFNASGDIEVDQQVVEQLVDVGVINGVDLTARWALKAESSQPKNLILLYLESFSDGLTEQPEYPGLTPNFNRLKAKYTGFNHLSSAYVTIEGIIASQCGTMLPMDAGNNTFLSNGELMANMPCLGDVLRQAGYKQYYLGGAVMEFAGKGRFFETHGYDDIRGWRHWSDVGYKQGKGVWGLSDTILFEEALKTIEAAAKNPPYNVTLLTLGTHLPGYTYPGCEYYDEKADPFINAVHCTDHLVGQFVDALEQKQLLDDAVLMVVADHGLFPNPTMKSLFGDMVKERTLIGLTNAKLPNEDTLVAGYDLAPTLLDLLGVKHNAQFLYGRSVFDADKKQQKMATRYRDWHQKRLVSNPSGSCEPGSVMSWPLNQCQKKQLRQITNQVLLKYSTKASIEPLGCEVDLLMNHQEVDGKNVVELSLNGEDHIGRFYHNGYLLKTLKKSDGIYIFTLNDDMDLVAYDYWPDHVDMLKDAMASLEETGDRALVIIKSFQPEVMAVLNKSANGTDYSFLYYDGGQKMTGEGVNAQSTQISLCE